MSKFGARDDHFGILAIDIGGGQTLGSVLSIIGSNDARESLSRAEAMDENNDPIAASWHGNLDGELRDVSNVFSLKSGSFNLNVLFLGEVEAGKIISTIEVAPANDGTPKITVTGKLGTKAVVAPPGKTNRWELPSMTIFGAFRAQPLGFTIDQGRLLSSSLNATIEVAQEEDGMGEPIAHGLSGGLLTGTANFNTHDESAEWTVTLAGAVETQEPGADQGQAAYETTTATWEKILVRKSAT